MKIEIEASTLRTDGHPDENQLLLALERELSPEEAAEVEHHLGSCWSCRARSHEMQRGILAFVEYREKRYLPSLESPPQDFRGFPGQLRNLAKESRSVGLFARIWSKIRRFVVSPSQVKWVTATAAIMAMVVFWTQVLFSPASVSASELLMRAEGAQNPIDLRSKGQAGRTAHQTVRISSGRESVVRDFEWTLGSPIPHARWEVHADPSKWVAPLTADGFAEWRDTASAKKEKVTRSADRWTLDTTADNGSIREARIVVRTSDFHPLEQHIRFADNRQLDFEEISFEIREPLTSIDESVTPTQVAESDPPKASRFVSEPATNLNETELLLRYTMFTHQWDLGEDLLITRTSDGIALTGTASSADRAASMQAVLGALPMVKLSISAPSIGEPPAASNAAPVAKSTETTTVPLLKDTLERAITSPEERRDFVDRCLRASDDELSHAWALKKLVDRYSEPERNLLAAESQAKLERMLATHLQRLGEADEELTPLIDLLPKSPVSRFALPERWRDRILALFGQVERQDSLVASLIAGAQANGRDSNTLSEGLRVSHEAIRSLLSGLTLQDSPLPPPK